MKNPGPSPTASNEGDLLEQQIRWLELRIRTAKGILGRLEKLSRRIEQRTPR